MIRLATEDRPDVLCLQELPVWSLKRLGGLERDAGLRRGRRAAAAAERRARPADDRAPPGPLPLGRSPGQANAILLRPELRACSARSRSCSTRSRSAAAISRELHLSRRMRATLGQGAPRLPGGPHRGPDRGEPARDRAARLAGRRRRAAARGRRSPTASPSRATCSCWPATSTSSASARRRCRSWPSGASRSRSRGSTRCSSAARGPGPAHRWPDERRRVDGRLLSDHAPVEVTIE